jgi:hypothetical protein
MNTRCKRPDVDPTNQVKTNIITIEDEGEGEGVCGLFKITEG